MLIRLLELVETCLKVQIFCIFAQGRSHVPVVALAEDANQAYELLSQGEGLRKRKHSHAP